MLLKIYADGQFRLQKSIDHKNPFHPWNKLLNELVVNMKQWIGAFREHDSLLQNCPEENLENAEREAIWS